MGKAGQVSAPGELAFLVMEGRGTMNKKINQEIQSQGENKIGVCASECLGLGEESTLETQEGDI